MKTLTLRGDDNPTSLVIALDEANGRAIVLARGSDEQVQVPYLEINFRDMSVSLFNSSDIGVTVDNIGFTNAQHLNVSGQVSLASGVEGGAQFGIDGVGPWIASSTRSGKRFRLVVDDAGNLQLPLPLIT